IVYKFEITIFESLKKSITLPLIPFKYLIFAFTPLTPLQKEIRDEERTIKHLEAQKADMERLEELKRKREAMFDEEGDKSEKYVIFFVNGVRIPPTFANERKAIEHIGKYYPKAIEIEWKEVGL